MVDGWDYQDDFIFLPTESVGEQSDFDVFAGAETATTIPSFEDYLYENFSITLSNGTPLSYGQVQTLQAVGVLTSDYQVAISADALPTPDQIQALVDTNLLSLGDIAIDGLQVDRSELDNGFATLSDLRAQIASTPEEVEGVSFTTVISAANQFADEYENQLNAFGIDDVIGFLERILVDDRLRALLAIIITITVMLLNQSNIAEQFVREFQRALEGWRRLLFPSTTTGIIVHEVRRTTVDGRQVNVRPLSDQEVRRRGLHIEKQQGPRHRGDDQIYEDTDTGELYIGSKNERTLLNPL